MTTTLHFNSFYLILIYLLFILNKNYSFEFFEIFIILLFYIILFIILCIINIIIIIIKLCYLKVNHK